jgi:hypothetical protein
MMHPTDPERIHLEPTVTVLRGKEAAPWTFEFTPLKVYRFIREHHFRKEVDRPNYKTSWLRW